LFFVQGDVEGTVYGPVVVFPEVVGGGRGGVFRWEEGLEAGFVLGGLEAFVKDEDVVVIGDAVAIRVAVVGVAAEVFFAFVGDAVAVGVAVVGVGLAVAFFFVGESVVVGVLGLQASARVASSISRSPSS
jgi:hypothetical protein